MSATPAHAEAALAPVTVAIGAYPHTSSLRASLGSRAPFAFADVSPINRAFAPMVRDLRFDIAELAVTTFLQAKTFGCPIVLLPVATASRFQEGALLRISDDEGLASPSDLRGRRLGVRSYAQTTAMWIRGILHDSWGVEPRNILWTVFEDAHVPQFSDPPFATRAPPGADLMGMLRTRALDAVIVGADSPQGDDLRPVFPDVALAERAFARAHGFAPVNHVVVAKKTLVEDRPEIVIAFLQALRDSYGEADARGFSTPPLGRAGLQPSLDLALRYATEQELIPSRLREDDLWGGLNRLSPALAGYWF